ncbi:hypothetical protein EDC04DRAFT_23276 [Pisolithus marmoratus]|nr:hypothetical protein EDC04DRAFT_23276 [Pisolithus marmoratus]
MGMAMKTTTQIALLSRWSLKAKTDCNAISMTFDCDPLLNLHAQDHDPVTTAHLDANRHEPGTFSVDLPDKLRHVLAISPSQDRNRREERVVRGLLYGDRVDHYDSRRGGEIWDAGEWDDGVRDMETEDDWEGEPVPWEVGEL